MSTPNRTPAGVPTGGQFAPTTHTEADTTLPAPRATSADADIALMDQLIGNYHRVVDDTAIATLKGISAQVRADHATARFLSLDESDQGDYQRIYDVQDADGLVLAEGGDMYEEFEGSGQTLESAMSYVQGNAWHSTLATNADGTRDVNTIDLDKVDELPAPKPRQTLPPAAVSWLTDMRNTLATEDALTAEIMAAEGRDSEADEAAAERADAVASRDAARFRQLLALLDAS